MLYGTIATRLEKVPFVVEFGVLVVPVLASVTVFAERPWVLLVLLGGITGLLALVPRRSLPPPLSPIIRPIKSETKRDEKVAGSDGKQIPPSPAVTVYRAHMMLMTIVCILAVDFPVFPRALAKCETFGVSVVMWTPSCVSSCLITRHLDGPWCRVICIFARARICSSARQGYQLHRSSYLAQSDFIHQEDRSFATVGFDSAYLG